MKGFKHPKNSGTIFTNKKKTTRKQPGWSGLVNVDGKVYKIDLWENYKKNDAEPYYTVKMARKSDLPPY